MFLISFAASAGLVLDANVFYLSDTFTYSNADSVYQRTFWDLTAGGTLTKKGQIVLGWNYGSLTFADNPGTETTLTVTDMGPKIYYYIDKELTWVIAATYNLITKADYSSGSSTSELRGTSIKAEAGYMPMITEGFYMGAKLNYYSVSFNEEVTNTTTLDQVTHKRTAIYPTFSFAYRF